MHQTGTDTDQLAALTRLIRIPADPSLLERMCDGDDDVRNATRPCGPLIQGGSPTVGLHATDLDVPEPHPPARLRRCETVVRAEDVPSLYHPEGMDSVQAARFDAELTAVCCGEPRDDDPLAESRYAASEADNLVKSLASWRARRPENEAAYQAAAPVDAPKLAPMGSVEPADWPPKQESDAVRPLSTSQLDEMYAAAEADGVVALAAWRARCPENEAAYQAAAPLRAMFSTTDHTRAPSTEQPMYDCDADLFADFPDMQSRRPSDAAASYEQLFERLDADADEWRAARAAESAPADQPPAKRRACLEEIRRRADVAAALYAMERACRFDIDVPLAPPTDSFSCDPPAWWAPWALVVADDTAPVVQRVGSVWRLNERRFLCFGPDTCDAETVADVRKFMLQDFELIVVSPEALVDAHRKIKKHQDGKPTELSDDDWRASPAAPRESTDDWVRAISRSTHAAHATQAFRAVLLRTAVDDRLVADPAESSTPTDALYITVYNEAVEHAIEHLANRAAMIY